MAKKVTKKYIINKTTSLSLIIDQKMPKNCKKNCFYLSWLCSFLVFNYLNLNLILLRFLVSKSEDLVVNIAILKILQ